jgi:hypothetical protein
MVASFAQKLIAQQVSFYVIQRTIGQVVFGQKSRRCSFFLFVARCINKELSQPNPLSELACLSVSQKSLKVIKNSLEE